MSDGFEDPDKSVRADESIARAFGHKAVVDPVSVSVDAFDALWSSRQTPKRPADRSIAEAFGRPVERDGFEDLRETDKREQVLGNLPALRSQLIEALRQQNRPFYPDAAVAKRMAVISADATVKSLQERGLRDGWSREQLESRLHDRIVEAGGKRAPVRVVERQRPAPRTVVNESEFDAVWTDHTKEK